VRRRTAGGPGRDRDAPPPGRQHLSQNFEFEATPEAISVDLSTTVHPKFSFTGENPGHSLTSAPAPLSSGMLPAPSGAGTGESTAAPPSRTGPTPRVRWTPESDGRAAEQHRGEARRLLLDPDTRARRTTPPPQRRRAGQPSAAAAHAPVPHTSHTPHAYTDTQPDRRARERFVLAGRPAPGHTKQQPKDTFSLSLPLPQGDGGPRAELRKHQDGKNPQRRPASGQIFLIVKLSLISPNICT